jgi:two-component system, LytTR family, sensor kinase
MSAAAVPLDSSFGRPLRLAIVGFWSTMGLVESSKAYVSRSLQGVPATWGEVLVANMPWWWTWALLTPVVFWFAERFRFDRKGWKVALPVHFGAALVAAFSHLALTGLLYYHTTTRALGVVPSGDDQIRRFVNAYLVVDIFIYVAIAGSYYAVDFYRRYRKAEVAAAQLEASMHQARLEALRMELNPHFLFNALNAVAGLVRRGDNEAAVNALARLGELLRLTLAQQTAQRSSLRDELGFLRQYLELERLRFRDRLTIEERVDAELLDLLVPTLILQPLVENAVRHGIARSPGPGRIEVSADATADRLRLAVRDSGMGLPKVAAIREGVGLSNTRARLRQLYGDRASLTLASLKGGGTEVVVLLPISRESAEGGCDAA